MTTTEAPCASVRLPFLNGVYVAVDALAGAYLIVDGPYCVFTKAEMPEKFRGKLKFTAGKCVGCKACVRDCPSNAITITKVGEKRFQAEFDLDKCIYCRSCVFACKLENHIPHEWQRNDVVMVGPDMDKDPVGFAMYMNCNHCEHPACIASCPVPGKAIHKREEDGLVLVDKEKCIGCWSCVKACPYGVPRPTNVKNSKGDFVVDKCTFCHHRVTQGLVPACVQTCVGRSRIFGDINDPASEVSYLVSTLPTQVLRPEEGTKPHVFYIGADRAHTEIGRKIYDPQSVVDLERETYLKNHS